jgi:hypothetical protein
LHKEVVNNITRRNLRWILQRYVYIQDVFDRVNSGPTCTRTDIYEDSQNYNKALMMVSYN